jgi:Asp-tRNA(Asn)/Glu-tRNA(Gln) amidotransferase A subunit family amidase
VNSDLYTLDARELAARIKARAVSPVEVVDAALDRIRDRDQVLNACTVVLGDDARQRAREAEQLVMAGGEVGPLHGVPVAIKDAIWVKGELATMGTRALENFRPDEDAAAVRRLRDAGAIVVAKTTNPELLWSGYTRSELQGVTRNPWNPERTPGGSSGGSGAAVASGMVPLALGTDAGGSIRIPAVYCGIVGLKPSHGAVPRAPGFEEMRTVNVFGPLARSVADARLCFGVIAGPDPADNLCVPLVVDHAISRDVKDMRIAFTPTLGAHAMEPSTAAAFDAAIAALGDAGWNLELAAPTPWDLDEITTPIYLAEQMGSHLDGREQLLGAGAARMVAAGARLPAKDYFDAQIRRAQFARVWESFLDDYDALLTPASVMPPFAADPEGPILIDNKPYELDTDSSHFIPSVIANLTGGPAVVVPTGVDDNGLPVSIQVMTKRFSDHRCMAVAEAIEGVLPPVGTPV